MESRVAAMLKLLLYVATVLVAHHLMKQAGGFSQPVLYPDPDHPLRYWWARRIPQRRPRP